MNISYLVTFIVSLISFLCATNASAQVELNANTAIPAYEGHFRMGMNGGHYIGFTEQDLAVLTKGDDANGFRGVGCETFRPGLFGEFVETYGYDRRIDAFEFFDQVGMKDHTLIVGFPPYDQKDHTQYCPGVESTLYANLYEPIWDDGSDGTPINEENYYANYLYKLIQNYGEYIKFWEIWNEPGFDYTGIKGFAEPGTDDNWWDDNPNPCDYKLRAPIFHYVRMLRVSYQVIKTLQADDYVVLSGVGFPSFLDAVMRNTDNPDDGSATTDYPLGGGAYFDVLGYHAYPHFDGSTQNWIDSLEEFEYFRHTDAAIEGMTNLQTDFIDVLDTYGYDGVTYPQKLWTITECNLPRKEILPAFGSDIAQINYLMKTWTAAQRLNYHQVHIYKLAESLELEDIEDPFDAMGFYEQFDRANGLSQTPTPSGIAMRTTNDLLFRLPYDATASQAFDFGTDKDGGFFTGEDGVRFLMIWAKTTTDRSETANATLDLTTINNLVDSVTLYHWDYGETNQFERISAQSTVALNATPVILQLTDRLSIPLNACSPYLLNLPHYGNYYEIYHGDDLIFSESSSTINYTITDPMVYTIKSYTISGVDTVAISTNTIALDKPVTVDITYNHNGSSFTFEAQTNQFADWVWSVDGQFAGNNIRLDTVLTEALNHTIKLIASNGCSTAQKVISVTSSGLEDEPLVHAHDLQAPTLKFNLGANLNYYPGWTDYKLAEIAAGYPAKQIDGVAAQSLKTQLPANFLHFWGYDIRAVDFQHYTNLGMRDIIAVLGTPPIDWLDSTEYCEGKGNVLFQNLYEPIWVNGQINPANYFAYYVHQTAETYKDQVSIWEVLSSPAYEPAGQYGWRKQGQPGNWWQNNPDPCDIALGAPITYYIRMLRVAYEVIHSVDPYAIVAIPEMNQTSFLDAILRNTDHPQGHTAPGFPYGGGAYFDAIGLTLSPHLDGSMQYYSYWLNAIVYERHSDKAQETFIHQLDTIGTILNQYGYGSNHQEKQFYVTKANQPRKSFSPTYGSDFYQMDYVMKLYTLARKHGVGHVSIASLAERKPFDDAQGPDDVMGLYEYIDNKTAAEVVKTNAGYGIELLHSNLDIATYSAAKTAQLNLPQGTEGAVFDFDNGNTAIVAWAVTWQDTSEWSTADVVFPASWTTDGYWTAYPWHHKFTGSTSLVHSDSIALLGTPMLFLADAFIPQEPIADMSISATQGCPTFTVDYEDRSHLADDIEWTFEGGDIATSTSPTVTVNYAHPGRYTTTLTATNAYGEHTYRGYKVIHVIDKPTALFDFAVTGTTVHFVNQAEGGAYYFRWYYGDGNWSGENEPSYTYSSDGTYDVQFVAFNDCGSDTITQTIIIDNILQSQANWSILDCSAGTVQFTDASVGSPDSWEYTLTNTSLGYQVISTDQDPIFTIPASGTYTLQLITTAGGDSDTITQDIILDIQVTIYNIQDTLCASETLTVHGTVFSIDLPQGEVRLPAAAANGCDSLIQVDLHFCPEPQDTINIELHPGESYTHTNGQTYTQAGTYVLTENTACGCPHKTYLVIEILTATAEIADSPWHLYPNPAIDQVYLTHDKSTYVDQVIWVNAAGQSLLMPCGKYFDAEGQSISVDFLPSGTYQLLLLSKKETLNELEVIIVK